MFCGSWERCTGVCRCRIVVANYIELRALVRKLRLQIGDLLGERLDLLLIPLAHLIGDPLRGFGDYAIRSIRHGSVALLLSAIGSSHLLPVENCAEQHTDQDTASNELPLLNIVRRKFQGEISRTAGGQQVKTRMISPNIAQTSERARSPE